MTTTLFSGGAIVTLSEQGVADWVLVDGERIASVGIGDPPPAGKTIDLDGATLVAAFCDAHVHLPATGLYATGMDLRGERRAAVIKHRFAQRADAGDDLLFGGNFEDPLDEPLTRSDLDDVVGERPALLARADMHSCIVSTTLLDRLDIGSLEGVDRDEDGTPTGYLREQAASEAWRWFDRSLTARQQHDAVRAAAQLAYAKGVATVHEMFVVEWRGWPSFAIFSEAAAAVALDIVVYLGTAEVDKVAGLGFTRIGGDFFLDGSFGSHTAWMKEPYASRPPSGSSDSGIRYRSDRELLDFFAEAQAKRLQVGVHAIGDAAIEQAISTWERVGRESGVDAVRALGHRIEHFECAGDDHIHRAAALGLRASVQPAFDRYWGGRERLYSERIGWERASGMNRFATMIAAGLAVGAGSDSTVTPIDPFLQMAALRDHQVSDESVDPSTALRVHTLAAAGLADEADNKGTIAAGKLAHLAVLDRHPLEIDPDELVKTEVLGTWIRGERVWPKQEAEAR